MFAGTFGVAAGAKAVVPSVPLWALMLAAQLLDILYVILSLAGLESARPVDLAHPNAYGGLLINAPYSHALATAGVLTFVAGLPARARWGRAGGRAIATVVGASWLLALVVHRADLPILPGNAGNLPLLGLGLWSVPLASAILEAGLVLGGAALYYRTAMRLPAPSIRGSAAYRVRAFTAALGTALLLLLALASSLLGIG